MVCRATLKELGEVLVNRPRNPKAALTLRSPEAPWKGRCAEHVRVPYLKVYTDGRKGDLTPAPSERGWTMKVFDRKRGLCPLCCAP